MRFVKALEGRKRAGFMPVIPDLKRRSPKEGDLFRGRAPSALIEMLAGAGAPVLSVVTERENFGGSMSLLREAAESGLPVLRKDFLRTPAEVEETARAGAAAVLVIAAILSDAEMEAMLCAARACGLDALAEIHSPRELARVSRLAPALVGINNRDILQWEKDGGTVHTAKTLIAAVPRPSFVVSESAIETAADVLTAARAGADAVLVGTAILKAADPAAKYMELSVKQ